MTALREAACCSNKFWECHLLVCTLRRAPSLWPPGPDQSWHPTTAAETCRALATGLQASIQNYHISHRLRNTFPHSILSIFHYKYFFPEVEWVLLMPGKYFRLLKDRNHCSPPLRSVGFQLGAVILNTVKKPHPF